MDLPKQCTLRPEMRANGYTDLQCTCVAFSAGETAQYIVEFKDGSRLKVRTAQIARFNDWAHEETIVGPGKFQGQRVAVQLAYDAMLDGMQHDDFGESEGMGYHCRVLFDGSPHIVCFVEDSQGFVTEITCDQYEVAFQDWAEASEQEEG